MTDNVIKLNKDNILRLRIETNEGKDTGEVLEFDLEDIELPLRYQELVERDKKNKEYLKNQMIIIEKRQDVKGKKILSKNEEDKIKAINDFFYKEVLFTDLKYIPEGETSEVELADLIIEIDRKGNQIQPGSGRLYRGLCL